MILPLIVRDPYYDSGPDPEGDPEAFAITMDQLMVGRLVRDEATGDWVLASRSPLTFDDVSIPGDYDDERARSSAVAWVEKHVRTEREDLLEDD
jgi:hypothetical protein